MPACIRGWLQRYNHCYSILLYDWVFGPDASCLFPGLGF